MLTEYLVTTHVHGQLSAKALCTVCWWAAKAGGPRPTASYGHRPDAPRGHFRRHLDSVMGVTSKRLGYGMLKIPVPRYTRWGGARASYELPIQGPREVLAAELEEDTSILRKLSVSVDEDVWPESVLQHEVVRSGGARHTLPCALFVDGVPTAKRDGCVGFFTHN